MKTDRDVLASFGRESVWTWLIVSLVLRIVIPRRGDPLGALGPALLVAVAARVGATSQAPH